MTTVQFPVVELRSSPHFKRGVRTDVIMLNVVYALTPVVVFSVFAFGMSALLLILTATLACVLTEHLICRITGKTTTIYDYSAVITGLLLAMCLPPGFPLWMAAVGGVVSIALGKALFGGLGCNIFNPALVGRAFLQAAFPVAITTWSPPFLPQRFSGLLPSTLAAPFMHAADIQPYLQGVDGFSGATPLSLMKFDHVSTTLSSLFVGTTPGSLGETSALLILVCGFYLIARNMMNWRIPVGVLLSVAVFAEFFHRLAPAKYPGPLFMVCAGGIMLGAVFMASDMVASPLTSRGVWVYSILIGFLTVMIRLFGGLPEGTMYAILLANAASPLIDMATQSRVYGARKVKANE